VLRAESRQPSSVHVATRQRYLADERECVLSLLPLARSTPEEARSIGARARELVEAVRRDRQTKGVLYWFV
jgi:hypothetical protein